MRTKTIVFWLMAKGCLGLVQQTGSEEDNMAFEQEVDFSKQLEQELEDMSKKYEKAIVDVFGSMAAFTLWEMNLPDHNEQKTFARPIDEDDDFD